MFASAHTFALFWHFDRTRNIGEPIVPALAPYQLSIRVRPSDDDKSEFYENG